MIKNGLIIKKDLLHTIVNAIFYQDHDDIEETFGEAVGELMIGSIRFLGEMKFSRKNEYEADYTAWELLLSSRSHDPRNMQNLLMKLWSLESMSEGKTSWEMTHPGTADRIEALQSRWEEWQGDVQ